MPLPFYHDHDPSHPWRREHDVHELPRAPVPDRRYYPGSLADLIAIVSDAEQAADPKPELRACGSHWALSDAAVPDTSPGTPDGYFIETNDPDGQGPRLNRPLYDVIPGCLSDEARRFFISQAGLPGLSNRHGVVIDPTKTADHNMFYLYHVEAGMKIWELYCRLDSGDSLSVAAGLEPYYLGPWAMETLGGAGGQTIVGALSTGTHGGDVDLPGIADAVYAVHLVVPEKGGKAKQYWIERPLPYGAPIVDDEKLRRRYESLSEIEILHDAELLKAVIVASGRMGIIYSVVLRVVRQYALSEVRVNSDWATARTWVNGPISFMFTNRFVQVALNPNSQPDNEAEHHCYVTVRNMAPLGTIGWPNPAGRAERCGPGQGGHSHPLPLEPGSFAYEVCGSASPVQAALGKIIDEVEAIRNLAAGTAVGLALLGAAPLVTAALAGAAALQDLIWQLETLRDSFPTGPAGRTVGVLAAWAGQGDEIILPYTNVWPFNLLPEWMFTRIGVFRALVGALMDSQQKPHALAAVSYSVMDVHDYLDIGCSVEGDSLEVFFDGWNPNLVLFVDRLLERVKELASGQLSGQRLPIAAYVSLRFMSRSSGRIAMQQWPRTCSLEIAGFRGVAGTEEFMARTEADAVALGATVHWGQRNSLTMKAVEQMYSPKGPAGPLFLWREALSRLTHNGRLATFSTAFTRARGLEVVQPKAYGLTVSPTNGCAGEAVSVTWDAEDNPPGTVAVLELRRAGFSNPHSIIPLPALAGTMSVVLPAGLYDFTLVVAYLLNDRSLTDERSVPVHGYADHDPLKFSAQAECVSIDGAVRWGFTRTLTSSFSPHLAVEELSCTFAPAVAWGVRRAGMPDLTFSPTNHVQQLPTRPALQGTWLFYLSAGVCSGTPPWFDAEFRLVCNQ